MFDRPTVIVLGAGASAPFGFPLGPELRDQILAGIGRVQERYFGSRQPALGPTSADNVRFFEKDSFHALASYITSPLARSYIPEDIGQDQVLNQLFEFRKDLDSSPQDTIDRFIWDNPNHQFIGKVLLSQEILLCMYEPGDTPKLQWRLRSFAGREYLGRRNWYQQLIVKIREGASDPQSLMDNELVIVTFNYDNSLERALQESFGDSTRYRGANYSDAVQILHVNGQPAELPPVITDAGKFVLQTARNLHLINEEVNSEVRQNRIMARTAISEAEGIFVMGFHFDDSNVKAIGLHEASNTDRIFCLNFNGHLGLKQKIIQLGTEEANISPGSVDRPKHIDQALDEGFLEQ